MGENAEIVLKLSISALGSAFLITLRLMDTISSHSKLIQLERTRSGICTSLFPLLVQTLHFLV